MQHEYIRLLRDSITGNKAITLIDGHLKFAGCSKHVDIRKSTAWQINNEYCKIGDLWLFMKYAGQQNKSEYYRELKDMKLSMINVAKQSTYMFMLEEVIDYFTGKIATSTCIDSNYMKCSSSSITPGIDLGKRVVAEKRIAKNQWKREKSPPSVIPGHAGYEKYMSHIRHKEDEKMLAKFRYKDKTYSSIESILRVSKVDYFKKVIQVLHRSFRVRRS